MDILVEESGVIPLIDAPTIYEIPSMLHERGLDEIIVRKFNLDCPPADLSEWKRVVEHQMNPKQRIKLVMVGKYMQLLDAYKSLNEAIVHAGIHTRTEVDFDWLDAEELEQKGCKRLEGADAILVPGGFGGRGFEGKVLAAKYARENRIPYLGICYGLHAAVVDFARNVACLEGANTTETDPDSVHPVIALITEWVSKDGSVEKRDKSSDLGGSMRMGEQSCQLTQGSKASQIYGETVIAERHRHRYEVNDNYVEMLENAGLIMAGRSEDDLVEMIELPDHPWFLACQFHPEFTSTPRDGHPLFASFVEAALKGSTRNN
jgi:CTP synthase